MSEHTSVGSCDGAGAADHDLHYVFNDHAWLCMGTLVQARMMSMRSHVQDTRYGFGQRYAGDLASGPSLEQFLKELDETPPAPLAA